MNDTILLVDYQNTRDSGLKDLPAHRRLQLFVGKGQKPKADFIQEELRKGVRVDFVPVIEDGNNNLDFHLAFYLGKLLLEEPFAEFLIISNDRDYDPLVRHVQGLGIACERRGTLRSAAKPAPARQPAAAKAAVPKAPAAKAAAPKPTSARMKAAPAPKQARAKAPEKAPEKTQAPKHAAVPPQDGDVADAIQLLKKAGSRRPKARAGLVTALTNYFHISSAEVGKLIDALAAQGVLAVSAQGVVTYKL